MRLRDILYFDFEKAASLLSQLEGGLTRERSQSSEEGRDSRNVRRYELFNTFKAEFGGISEEKKAVMETKILHHDLLIRVEQALFEMGLACDAARAVGENTPESERDVHAALAELPYLQAEGWCAFEDFRKVYEATQNFNDLLRFIKRSELTTKYDIDELANSVDAILSTEGKNSKRYKDARDQHKAVEKAILEEIEKCKVPEWLLAGVREWIDTYIKDRLNMRVCPFESFPNVEVIANLKRTCFVDDDLTHLMYGYGSEPNVRLSVFGLVTSVPPEEGDEQFRMYPDDEEEAEEEAGEDLDSDGNPLEKAFRNLFPALRNMEHFTSFHHYPRIIVHPVAVYRNVSTDI